MSIIRSRKIQAVAWATLTTVALLAPGRSVPRVPSWLPLALAPVADKLVHALLFFVLGLLTYRALAEKGHEPGGLGSTVLAVWVFVVLLEIAQRWVPNRTFEILDILAGLAGALVAAVVILSKYR